MNIHYTYRDYNPVSIQYDLRDKHNVWINMHMQGFLTPEIVQDHMVYLLDNNVPEGLVEAILTYPEDQIYGKDITVVFEAGS